MKKRCFVILNHQITEKQKKELKERFHIKEIYFLSEKLKNFISEIDPEKWIDENILDGITSEIASTLKKGDYLWVQTEYGLTCYLVQFGFKNNFIPIYSTTKRIMKEKSITGEKVKREYIFEHEKFRFYRELKNE